MADRVNPFRAPLHSADKRSMHRKVLAKGGLHHQLAGSGHPSDVRARQRVSNHKAR